MLMELKKRCSRCGATNPLSGFYRNAAGKFGHQSVCKACCAADSKHRVAAVRALGAARIPARKRCAMCKGDLPASDFSFQRCSNDGLRTYCRECDRIVRRSDKYGLTRGRVMEMLTQTKCEACGKRLPSAEARHIDHRHSDGAVRGILCDRCNTTLGKCEENPEILLGICRYIARTMDVDYRKQPYLKQKCSMADSSTADALTPEGTARKCQTNTTHQPTSQQP